MRIGKLHGNKINNIWNTNTNTFAKSLARNGPNHEITRTPPFNEYKRKETQAFSHFLPSTRTQNESWWRIDRRAGPNQFFRRSRQLPVAITFDPELRLTHGLRLREALVTLFPSITHEQRGVWRLKWVTKVKSNGKLVLGYSMARRKSRVSIELGIQGFESTPHPKFPKLPRLESIRLVNEPIRFLPVFKFNVQNAL
ncbi:hypothetical protein PIB30_055741 [Stylosanthes scabra]|uniref:Uncharacterized protein n=1 Tax=Stylosanthes scabra TaxID=79078 RepID=A0ABU6RJV8_9FABA|nr:hypothetical protein [Stylosanthes scabra]